jgi:hypothetical protein
MDRESPQNLQAKLRKRVGDFLEARGAHGQPLGEFFREIRERGRAAFLFGGALRDLTVHGLRKTPRDLDVVVSEITPDLARYFGRYLQKRTRFGGYQLRVSDWDLDVWALQDTWAFRENRVIEKDFAHLPKTTFLDVQAVVAELTPRPGKPRRIYSNGFFEAIASETIDTNLEENPFPSMCVLTALMTASTLRFAMAPRLVAYVLGHVDRIELDELVDLQRCRGEGVLLDCDALRRMISSLRSQYREAPTKPVRLPRVRAPAAAF